MASNASSAGAIGISAYGGRRIFTLDRTPSRLCSLPTFACPSERKRPNKEVFDASFSCGRRRSLSPLGGLPTSRLRIDHIPHGARFPRRSGRSQSTCAAARRRIGEWRGRDLIAGGCVPGAAEGQVKWGTQRPVSATERVLWSRCASASVFAAARLRSADGGHLTALTAAPASAVAPPGASRTETDVRAAPTRASAPPGRDGASLGGGGFPSPGGSRRDGLPSRRARNGRTPASG